MEVVSTQNLLLAIVSGTTLFVVALGGVLAYHWLRYSFNKTGALIAVGTFSAVAVLALGFLFLISFAL